MVILILDYYFDRTSDNCHRNFETFIRLKSVNAYFCFFLCVEWNNRHNWPKDLFLINPGLQDIFDELVHLAIHQKSAYL